MNFLEELNQKTDAEIKAVFKGFAKLRNQSIQNFINTPDKNNFSIMMHAAEHNCHVVVQFLIRNNANVNFQGARGATALHIACQRGHSAVVEEILAAKDVNLDIKNDAGETAKRICQLNLPNAKNFFLEEKQKLRQTNLTILNLFVMHAKLQKKSKSCFCWRR